jgi:hypothetical protein
MTLLAFHDGMVAQQQKLRHRIVLEGGCLPILLAMASFTLFAFLTFVLVIFFVTRDTSHFQLVFIQIAFVAT